MGENNRDDDRQRLDEIYCAPTEDVTIGVVLAYGERKGEIVTETAKAGALAVNYNTPLLSGNPTLERVMTTLRSWFDELQAGCLW